MQTFKIKIVSPVNFLIVIFLFAVIMTPVIILRARFLPTPLGTPRAILFAIPLLIVFYLLFQWLATARIKVTLSEEHITIQWLKQFAFKNKPDYLFKWDEIEKYKIRSDPNYSSVKLKLVSGESLKFYHDHLQLKDKYYAFIKAFEHLCSQKLKR